MMAQVFKGPLKDRGMIATSKPSVWQHTDLVGSSLKCDLHTAELCDCVTDVIKDNDDGSALWLALQAVYRTVTAKAGAVGHWSALELNKRLKNFVINVPVMMYKGTKGVVIYTVDVCWGFPSGYAGDFVDLETAKLLIKIPDQLSSEDKLEKIGILSWPEGRLALRQMVINRYTSLFPHYGECKSPRHSSDQHALQVEKLHKDDSYMWFFYQCILVDNLGLCSVCLKRSQDREKKAYESPI